MTLNTIDAKQALALLTEVIEERGRDFVYEPDERRGACVYAAEGEPDCLVGRVLAKAGLPVATLEELDKSFAPPGFQLFADILHEEGVVLTKDAITLLGRAQEMQDTQEPYGEVLESALAWSKGLGQ